MLTVVKRQSGAPPDAHVKVGKLFMVDLAGSERLKKSHSTGIGLSSLPQLVPVRCMLSVLR